MTVSAQFAEEHFAEVLGSARGGVSVEIQDRNESFRLTLIKPLPLSMSGRRKERMGAWEGQFPVPTSAEWVDIKKAFSAEMPDFSKSPDEAL